jgi:hypothetical protein
VNNEAFNDQGSYPAFFKLTQPAVGHFTQPTKLQNQFATPKTKTQPRIHKMLAKDHKKLDLSFKAQPKSFQNSD